MFIIYLILGALAGTMSGLLGIGGGMIVVPALSAIFLQTQLMPSSSVMHMAIGTSLAVMVFTSLSGLYAHHRRMAVRWDVFKIVVPSLVIGTLLGALIANTLSSEYLRIFFGLFLFVMGLRMLLDKNKKEVGNGMSHWMMWAVSSLIGGLSSILGIGGGVMLVPFLLRCRVAMHQAPGTSLACGMTIGIFATVSFMLPALGGEQVAPWSTGYIYWPAFLWVAVASILFAPIGTALAHKLPTSLLKKIFAVMLLMVAGDMLFFA